MWVPATNGVHRTFVCSHAHVASGPVTLAFVPLLSAAPTSRLFQSPFVEASSSAHSWSEYHSYPWLKLLQDHHLGSLQPRMHPPPDSPFKRSFPQLHAHLQQQAQVRIRCSSGAAQVQLSERRVCTSRPCRPSLLHTANITAADCRSAASCTIPALRHSGTQALPASPRLQTHQHLDS